MTPKPNQPKPNLVKRQLTLVSEQYDLDGDGILNETEQFMRDRDTENRGYLTNDQIYEIVQREIDSKKAVHMLKKFSSGLICLVVLFAVCNVGTSTGAALYARDVKADMSNTISELMSLLPGGDAEDEGVPAMRIAKTDEIVGAQTTGETFIATEMSDDELDERRRLVIAEMDEDPHSHSHRRQLQIECRARREECMDMSGFISFDSHSISMEEFTNIENKCKQQRNVNIKRRWGDYSKEIPVCGRGTRVVVRKKKKKKRNNNKNKDKDEDRDEDEDSGDIMDNGPCNGGECATVGKRNSRNMIQRKYFDKDVIIERDDGSIMHADCQGNLCFIGGTMFRGQIGDFCRIKSDECSVDCVCKQSNKKSRNKKFGTCIRATIKDVVIVRGGNGLGARCVATDGRDACDSKFYCLPNDFRVFDFKKSKRKLLEYRGLGTCTRTVALGQTCYSDYDCGGKNYCDGLRPGKYGVCARPTTAIGTIAKRAKKNQDCKISYGLSACVTGFACYPTGVIRDEIGVRRGNVKVGVCQRVKKRRRMGEVCSIDYGYSACEAGYHCLSANGLEIRVGSFGFCTTPSVITIGRNAKRDEMCRIDFGLNACRTGLGCYVPGRPEARRVSAGICDVVSRSAPPNTVCDVSFGNNACVSGYECRSAVGGQYDLCTRSTSVGGGGGGRRWYVNYDLGTQGGCINDGNANSWETTWPTANECCKQHLWWMTKNQCVWDANGAQIIRDTSSNDCLPAGASFADDCTNSQQCSGRRSCLKNCTPGSDRWFCY